MIRGELTWGGSDTQPNRIWLAEDADLAGIGLALTRSTTGADGAECESTRVRYLLWRGDASDFNTTYTNCQ